MTDLPAQLRARRRTDHEVQLGLGDSAVILAGLSARETHAITQLGPLTALQWSLADSTRPPSARWHEVIELLGRAARDIVQHTDPIGVVAVTGHGPVPRAITAVLASVAAQVMTTGPDIDRVSETGGADLVVLPCTEGIAPHRYAGWQRRGMPHLPVVVSPCRVVIGPLVRPGRSGPCLRCLDLHRSARDPRWPELVSQLEADTLLPGEVTTSPDLAAVAAGLVGLTARGLLHHRPLPAGLCLSVCAPHPRVQHHMWSPHPACGCQCDETCDTPAITRTT